MGYSEQWAVSRERIEGFFREQPDVKADGTGFVFGTCRIRLTELAPHSVGPVQVPYTLVEMTGDGADTEIIHRRFFLRFISAGG